GSCSLTTVMDPHSLDPQEIVQMPVQGNQGRYRHFHQVLKPPVLVMGGSFNPRQSFTRRHLAELRLTAIDKNHRSQQQDKRPRNDPYSHHSSRPRSLLIHSRMYGAQCTNSMPSASQAIKKRTTHWSTNVTWSRSRTSGSRCLRTSACSSSRYID